MIRQDTRAHDFFNGGISSSGMSAESSSTLVRVCTMPDCTADKCPYVAIMPAATGDYNVAVLHNLQRSSSHKHIFYADLAWPQQQRQQEQQEETAAAAQPCWQSVVIKVENRSDDDDDDDGDDAFQIECDIYTKVIPILSRTCPHFIHPILSSYGGGGGGRRKPRDCELQHALFEIMHNRTATPDDPRWRRLEWQMMDRSSSSSSSVSAHDGAVTDDSNSKSSTPLFQFIHQQLLYYPDDDDISRNAGKAAEHLLRQIMFQLAYTMHCMEQVQLQHNDLHMGNIFVEQLAQPLHVPLHYQLADGTHIACPGITTIRLRLFDWDRATLDMHSPLRQSPHNLDVMDSYPHLHVQSSCARHFAQVSQFIERFDWCNIVMRLRRELSIPPAVARRLIQSRRRRMYCIPDTDFIGSHVVHDNLVALPICEQDDIDMNATHYYHEFTRPGRGRCRLCPCTEMITSEATAAAATTKIAAEVVESETAEAKCRYCLHARSEHIGDPRQVRKDCADPIAVGRILAPGGNLATADDVCGSNFTIRLDWLHSSMVMRPCEYLRRYFTSGN